jgi:hypothetical protein
MRICTRFRRRLTSHGADELVQSHQSSLIHFYHEEQTKTSHRSLCERDRVILCQDYLSATKSSACNFQLPFTLRHIAEYFPPLLYVFFPSHSPVSHAISFCTEIIISIGFLINNACGVCLNVSVQTSRFGNFPVTRTPFPRIIVKSSSQNEATMSAFLFAIAALESCRFFRMAVSSTD